MDRELAEALTEELRGILGDIRKERRAGTSQTVIHKSNMGGFVAGIAVTACVLSMFVTMFVARSISNDLHEMKGKVENDLRDQKAWTEVLRGKVATIEGKLQPSGVKQP